MYHKSAVVTYMLWLMFGWFGIHHIYLQRYRHAFVWLWTAGGCCGVGWLLEMPSLASYVQLANSSCQSVSATCKRVPPVGGFHWKTFAGELMFAMVLGVLSVSAVPKPVLDLCPFLFAALAAFFTAAGAHTVANTDHQVQCTYASCLLGAVVPLPLVLVTSTSSALSTYLTYSSLCSVVAAQLCARPCGKPSTSSRWQPLLALVAANLLMTALLTSSVYHNCHITTRDGTQVPVRHAIHNILVSPAWAQFRQTAVHLATCLLYDGLHKFIYELRVVLDPEGEASAYRSLGFSDWWSVSEQQLTERYRQLVRQLHPDKVRAVNDLDRAHAQQTFIDIQRAYDKLSVIRRRRTSRNEL